MRIKFDGQESMMQASRSINKCLDALPRQKDENKIPGILGRLGDLGAIDSKYDTAVSTACGPLDNIVVDTVNTAQECIKYLKENDIGQATFIALEKQQRFAQQCQEKIRTPDNVHRLFDLIKVEDERVLPAFYYALQNTLVANDLEQATRIAYGAQRNRVVTLKGELIEMSGTMSGGGRTVSRGRMGQKVVSSEPKEKDVAQLQRTLDEIYRESNELHAQQIPLQNQIQTLTLALTDMKQDRDRFRTELKALIEQEPFIKQQMIEQEKKVTKSVCDARKVQELSKVIEKEETNLKKVQENAQKMENQVESINQQIDEISGNRVKEQQKKISNLKKSFDKTKAEICRLGVAIKTAERNMVKSEQRIETLENDIKEGEQRIRDIQQEKVGFEEKAKKILDQLKVVNEQLEERDELSASLKKELDKMQTRESNMKAVKIDLDQKINQKNKILKELKQRIPELARPAQSLKLQEIPNENNEKLKELTEEELRELDIKHVAAQVQKAKEKLPKDIPNMQIIEQYKEQNAIYLKRSESLHKLTEERNRMRESCNLAIRRRMQEFNAGFNLITAKLKEMYRMITLGGDAELELVDSLDPFSEGIVFSVRPPKKSWKYIQNLSGGEKTLSSLALVFALNHHKPTPLYFMDEIDAALDFKNVSIVASYIKGRTKNAQFIVVSHRSDMFELADYLVGIYKIFNCSNCAVLDVRKFNKKVGIDDPPNNLPKQTLSQPAPKMSHSSNNENIGESLQPQRLNFPLTCPENIGGRAAPSLDENRDTNQADITLGLGDLSIPGTPQKTPVPPCKKRKTENGTPRATTDQSSPTDKTPPLRRDVRNTLEQVSRNLETVAAIKEKPTKPPPSDQEKRKPARSSTPIDTPRRSARQTDTPRRSTSSRTSLRSSDEDSRKASSLRKRRRQ